MFNYNFQKRSKIFFIICIIIFLLVIFKVFYLEVINYSFLNNNANNLWSRKLPITADRGLITDRNGDVLASNITTLSLYVVPNQIKNKKEVASFLASILNVSYDNIYKHISKKTSIEKIHPEGRQLSKEIADKINEKRYDGVYLLRESKRYYPYKTMLSHVLGFVGIDNQGLSGIEAIYDNYLKGTDGSIEYFSDGRGNKLNLPNKYNPPVNGMTISLTINKKIQETIENELDNVISKYNPEEALVIVANPKTGEILGMSSRPNFDPNNYQDYDIKTISRNLPIFNTYEPGSTFKVITLASAIEEKKINLFTDKYYDTGKIIVSNNRINCWKLEGHGEETFLEVVENSCNPGFVVMGQKLGKEILMNYVNKFGFGEKTGIDLNGEENGILFKVNNMGPLELATTSFGQGVSVTPIQQVMGISAAINGGNLLEPFIVKYISNSNSNEILYEHKIKIKQKVISEETSNLVRYALESVVAKGTGRNAYIEGYRVGGKTGTAQKVSNGAYMEGNYILSFIGFLPSNNPEVIVYVAIDNPKGVIQYGGTVSAPIAKNIMQSAIDSLEIKKEKSELERKYELWDTVYYEVPNLIGLNKKNIRNVLNINIKVEYAGDGDNIIDQSPKMGKYISSGSVIKVLLG